MVNYRTTDVGKAEVQVLEKNGIEMAFPSQQCCGMPSFDVDDTEAMVKAAKANLRFLKPWTEQGYDVVIPVPSCSLMLNREYPVFVAGDEIAQLSKPALDICEYLMGLKRAGTLSTDFVRTPGVWHIKSRVTFAIKTSDLVKGINGIDWSQTGRDRALLRA
jgi:Fe-S oxidoreductase